MSLLIESIDRIDKAIDELLCKFNPNHDNDGRFTTGGGVHMAPDTGGSFGGGSNKYAEKLKKDAITWVNSQEEWDGKVTTEDINVSMKQLVPSGELGDGTVITTKTVKKYERQVEKEIKEYGSIQRPFVVTKMGGDRFFIQDGNHYYHAVKNLYMKGKLTADHVKLVKAVEVKPKNGWRFEMDRALAQFHHFSQVLVADE